MRLGNRSGWWLVSALLLAVSLLPRTALAAVVRYAVLVANNAGDSDEVRLRYAEEDARKMADVLQNVGGFSAHQTVLLQGATANQVVEALREVNERIRRDVRAGDEVIFFVFYSGHASETALHLGGTRLPLRDLERMVLSSPATIRLMVADACRSGALTRVKGGSIRSPFEVKVEATLGGEGAVFLTSSAAGEDAQESDFIKGSFFTHYLVSGLLGAADHDRDGAVTVDEAYQYAHDRTLAESSRTLAGIQHPTFAYDLKGRGTVVLTRPWSSRRRGRLRVPAGRTYLILHGNENGPVVAEVGGQDASRTVSLQAGTYFVIGRTRDFLLEGKVEMPAGRLVELDESRLQRSEYARLVRKGEGSRKASHGPQVGYRLRSPLHRDGRLCHGVYGGYLVETRFVSIFPRVAWCREGFENDVLESVIDEYDLTLRLSHVWDFPVVSLELGIAGGAGLLHQRFQGRVDAEPRLTADGHIGGVVGLLWELPAGFYLVTDGAAETYFLRQSEGEEQAGVTATFVARGGLGVGKRF